MSGLPSSHSRFAVASIRKRHSYSSAATNSSYITPHHNKNLSKWRPRRIHQQPYKCSEELSVVGSLRPPLHPKQQQRSSCGRLGLGLDHEIQTLCQHGKLDEALYVLSCMDHHGTVPSDGMYMSLLGACNKKKAISQINRVYVHVSRHRTELTRALGESLMITLVKCGAFDNAWHVFHRLAHHTVRSWTAMISGYTACGKGIEALKLYECMLREGFEPDCHTFVSLLKACASIPDLQEGKNLHAELHRKGFASDVFICHTLVSMYGKCGSIVDAESVFSALSQRNIVSWNVMLTAYVDKGEGKKALHLYRQMQEEDMQPNERTFVSILRACCTEVESFAKEGYLTRAVCIEIGQALHADAWKKGFAYDIFIGCTLVNMYGKCGSVMQSECVFIKLSQCNVVSWNAMLSAYIDQGEVKMALHLYRRMQEEGVNPNERTFVVVLQACCPEDVVVDGELTKVRCLEIGRALHIDARRQGFASDVFVGSTLVNMYGKCGSTVEAESVFSGLSQRNILSWNALLSAYVDLGEGNKALQLYRQIKEEDLSSNGRTFAISVKACYTAEASMKGHLTELAYLEIGQALHADAWRKGFASDVFIGSTIIRMYAKFGHIAYAESVFVGSSQQDTISWNAMLSAYVEQGQGEKALQLYTQMQKKGMISDHQTFVSTLQACNILAEKEEAAVVEGQMIKVMSLKVGRALHADARSKGFASHFFVASALVIMYGKCGSIREAEVVLSGFSRHNVVPWNAMLSAYLEQGQEKRALELYRRMQDENVTLDDVTLVCVLQACSEAQSVEICRQSHFALVCVSYYLTPILGNALVHAYGHCASMVNAQAVLNGLLKADILAWSALISGYAGLGNCGACQQSFEQMELTGVKPDGITFLSLLSACNHDGLVEKGVFYFESMTRDYGIIPESKHYVSMIDLLGRAGDLTRVQNILCKMPMQPDLATWMGLLGSCRTHGNMELGKQVFSQTVQLQPNEAAVYVLMSNIYGDAGLQDCADQLVGKVHGRSLAACGA